MLKDYEIFKGQFIRNILDIDFSKHYNIEKKILNENKFLYFSISQIGILSYNILLLKTTTTKPSYLLLTFLFTSLINYNTFLLHSWKDKSEYTSFDQLSKAILSEGFLIRKDYLLCMCLGFVLYPYKLHLEANKFRYLS